MHKQTAFNLCLESNLSFP